MVYNSSICVGCKKLHVIIKNLRSDFVVNVLRTTQYIHRIHSIDIVSLWEIPAIACKAFISIENEPPQNNIACKAFISIENEPLQNNIACRARTKKGTNNFHNIAIFLASHHLGYYISRKKDR
jgi:hypothetical protein